MCQVRFVKSLAVAGWLVGTCVSRTKRGNIQPVNYSSTVLSVGVLHRRGTNEVTCLSYMGLPYQPKHVTRMWTIPCSDYCCDAPFPLGALGVP